MLNFLLSVATPDALEEETAIFLGRYETGRTIGVGGYAEVKIGKDLKLDRKVAIKVIQKDMADAKGLERLEREINFLSCINHPNIVKLYDVVEADKTTVLVMQLLEGETLDDFVYEAPGQCLPPYVCKFLFKKVLDGRPPPPPLPIPRHALITFFPKIVTERGGPPPQSLCCPSRPEDGKRDG